MEPLTAGAIALLTLLLDKTWDKSGDIIVDKIFQQGSKVFELLMHKHPDLSRRLAAAKENPALPSQQPEDYGEAVLIEDIKSAAADPKIKAAIEELAAQVEEAPKNSELEKAFIALAEKVNPQTPTTTIENWKGINIKGGTNTISSPSFNFGSKGD
jgi:hypothetical protein